MNGYTKAYKKEMSLCMSVIFRQHSWFMMFSLLLFTPLAACCWLVTCRKHNASAGGSEDSTERVVEAIWLVTCRKHNTEISDGSSEN